MRRMCVGWALRPKSEFVVYVVAERLQMQEKKVLWKGNQKSDKKNEKKVFIFEETTMMQSGAAVCKYTEKTNNKQ